MTQRRLIETNIRDRRQLMNKIQNAKIVVMIAQMFLNCLRRGYTKLQDYVLVVFDECHHCQGDHPFGSIMREFYFEQKQKQEVKEQAEKEIEFKDRLPIIMGLTASPVSSVYFEPERLTK
jgi:endoribonuclease Dicer